jgi:hypothetical protein
VSPKVIDGHRWVWQVTWKGEGQAFFEQLTAQYWCIIINQSAWFTLGAFFVLYILEVLTNV